MFNTVEKSHTSSIIPTWIAKNSAKVRLSLSLFHRVGRRLVFGLACVIRAFTRELWYLEERLKRQIISNFYQHNRHFTIACAIFSNDIHFYYAEASLCSNCKIGIESLFLHFLCFFQSIHRILRILHSHVWKPSFMKFVKSVENMSRDDPAFKIVVNYLFFGPFNFSPLGWFSSRTVSLFLLLKSHSIRFRFIFRFSRSSLFMRQRKLVITKEWNFFFYFFPHQSFQREKNEREKKEKITYLL